MRKEAKRLLVNHVSSALILSMLEKETHEKFAVGLSSWLQDVPTITLDMTKHKP